MPRKLTPFQHEQICQRYQDGESAGSLATEYGVGKTTVLRLLTRRGVPRHEDHTWRRHSMDHSYFDRIDTPEKAFFLGLITADGCNHGTGSITQVCKRSDRAILEQLRDALESTVPILDYMNGTHPGSMFSFRSPQIAGALDRVGVGPRKSLTAEAWSGPQELLPHYWRGVWSGDGWICHTLSPRSIWTVGLCGSHAMMASFTEWLAQFYGLALSVYKQGKISTVSTAGVEKPQSVLRAMECHAPLCLERKSVLALELLCTTITTEKRKGIHCSEVRELYESGMSVGALQQHYGCSDTCIRSRIKQAGGKIRTHSEANRNRYRRSQ